MLNKLIFRKILLSLYCSAFVIFSGNGQASGPGGSSLLWEISGPGLPQPSYLYGTFHLLCPQDLKLSAAARQAFDSSRQLFLEVDIDDPQTFVQLQQQLLTPGQPLTQLLSTADYAYLKAYFRDSLQQNLDAYAGMKPVLLSALLYGKMLGCTPGSPEMALAQQASLRKIPVEGLESISEQMAVLDSVPVARSAQELVLTVRHLDSSRTALRMLLAHYKSGHADSLQGDMAGFSAPEKERLLYRRNRNWLPVMERAMRQKPTFFAVGAGHLGGPQGVVALLRQRGYRLRPLAQREERK